MLEGKLEIDLMLNPPVSAKSNVYNVYDTGATSSSTTWNKKKNGGSVFSFDKSKHESSII